MQNTVVCVVGPTASGKTRLGVALAHELDGEVVSADSMQIYRRMDIGTAKPTEAEMEGIPHHMIDVAEPEENWSAARYVEAATRVWRIFSAGESVPSSWAAPVCTSTPWSPGEDLPSKAPAGGRNCRHRQQRRASNCFERP